MDRLLDKNVDGTVRDQPSASDCGDVVTDEQSMSVESNPQSSLPDKDDEGAVRDQPSTSDCGDVVAEERSASEESNPQSSLPDKDDDGTVQGQPSTSDCGDVVADERSMSEQSNPQSSLQDKDHDGTVQDQPSTSDCGDVVADEQSVSEEPNPQNSLHGDQSTHFSPAENVSRMHQDVSHEMSGNDNNNSDLMIQFGSNPPCPVRNPHIGESSSGARANEDVISFSFINIMHGMPYGTILEELNPQSSLYGGPSPHFFPAENVLQMHQDVSHEMSGNDDNNSDLIRQFGSNPSHTVQNPHIGESSSSARANENSILFSSIYGRHGMPFGTILEEPRTQHGTIFRREIHGHYLTARNNMAEGDQPNNSSGMSITNLAASFNSLNLNTPSQNNAQSPMPLDPNPYDDGHPFSPAAVEAALARTWNFVMSAHLGRPRMVSFRLLVPYTNRQGDTSASAIDRQICSGLPHYSIVPRGRDLQAQSATSSDMATSESSITHFAGSSSAPLLSSFTHHGLAIAPAFWAEVPNIRRTDAGSSSNPSNEEICRLCEMSLKRVPPGAEESANPPCIAVLPCGHAFHEHCLRMATPSPEPANPPCICCQRYDHQ